jgi:hypothetical protein
MTSDTTYTGYESELSEGYLQPDKVRVHFRCDRCGHEYSRVYNAIPQKNAVCPKQSCKDAIALERAVAAQRNVTEIIETGKTPGITGRNPMVGIVDQTAAQVMEDYKLTDLKDNIRPGESMAPKLQGKLQVAADQFFAGGAGQNSKQAQLISRRALSGAYRNMSVAPSAVFTGTRGQPALRKI